ncbi:MULTISPECIES: pirin family protein [unclassified Moraxella]|uniref:pirin family protein n=1 Tax=unclassified Moraxella TaxID=2685852 RepID=UPI003AF7EE41
MSNQTTQKTYRQVDKVHLAPRPHWVGDGFHVNPMFSHMAGDKRTDPFLMLDYAASQFFEPNQASPRGVGQHPHKGFETVTIAYQGEVSHRDSSGGGGTIKTGDVQWMTAGNGVIHEEFHSEAFSQTGGDFEMVQLWVNLPARDKTTPAKYQHLAHADMPVVKLTDESGQPVGKVTLIAGEFANKTESVKGTATTFTPINLWDVVLEPNRSVELAIPRSHNLLLLVREGDVTMNADSQNRASARQLITFEVEQGGEGEDYIRLSTGMDGAKLVLMSGEPINEPIVGYGPFVMNTQQEIRQAILDFNAGKFGQMA